MRSLSIVHIGSHLRQGTYDITSELCKTVKIPLLEKKKPETPEILKNEIDFIRNSIEWREIIKFEYTKNLSMALELIAKLGETLGFSREDMSYLDIDTILSSKDLDDELKKEIWSCVVASRRKRYVIQEKLSLPPLIFSSEDFSYITSLKVKPNFITKKSIKAKIVHVSKKKLDGVVVIKNADPGYDWIFTKKIKGLVTCYGGVASHMSIRCAEQGIPSAIGCGEELYKKIEGGKMIFLDAKNEKIEVDGVRII